MRYTCVYRLQSGLVRFVSLPSLIYVCQGTNTVSIDTRSLLGPNRLKRLLGQNPIFLKLVCVLLACDYIISQLFSSEKSKIFCCCLAVAGGCSLPVTILYIKYLTPKNSDFLEYMGALKTAKTAFLATGPYG